MAELNRANELDMFTYDDVRTVLVFDDTDQATDVLATLVLWVEAPERSQTFAAEHQRFLSVKRLLDDVKLVWDEVLDL